MNPLVMRGLVKRYDDFQLACDFEVRRGYVTGLVGANGSGKTTLIRCALGATKPDAGEVELVDKARVAVCWDTPPYKQDWTVGGTGRQLRRFYPTWSDDRFASWCARWELPAKAKVKSLSRGQGMRLQMAVGLSYDTELLILDEPTSGLDPLARDELVELLADLMIDERRSILFSSHITSDLEKIADFVTVVDDGRVLESAPLDELKARYRVVRGGGVAPEGLIGTRQTGAGWEALATTTLATALGPGVVVEPPTLEDIAIRLAKRGRASRRHGREHADA